jgi:hypothetical protein
MRELTNAEITAVSGGAARPIGMVEIRREGPIRQLASLILKRVFEKIAIRFGGGVKQAA